MELLSPVDPLRVGRRHTRRPPGGGPEGADRLFLLIHLP